MEYDDFTRLQNDIGVSRLFGISRGQHDHRVEGHATTTTWEEGDGPTGGKWQEGESRESKCVLVLGLWRCWEWEDVVVEELCWEGV